jgi:hypothetical protein
MSIQSGTPSQLIQLLTGTGSETAFATYQRLNSLIRESLLQIESDPLVEAENL